MSEYKPDEWQRKFLDQANATYNQKVEHLQVEESRARAALVNATTEVRAAVGAPQTYYWDPPSGTFLAQSDGCPDPSAAVASGPVEIPTEEEFDEPGPDHGPIEMPSQEELDAPIPEVGAQ